MFPVGVSVASIVGLPGMVWEGAEAVVEDVVVEVERAVEPRAGDVEALLRQLPEWFGVEEALARYVDNARHLLTWVAVMEGATVGACTMRDHGSGTAEIDVLAVRPDLHRRGVGRRLLAVAEQELREAGIERIQVKTLGASRVSEGYERTRRFYEAVGYALVEEFPAGTIWPNAPCLLMIKHLADQEALAAARARVLVLSGPSSAGKTSLARALQRTLWTQGRLVLHVEADRLVPGLPVVDHDDPRLAGLLDALTGATLAFADHGYDLIVDGLLPYGDQASLERVLGRLARHDVRYVGVRCALDELAQRESTRPDQRQPGWAVTQATDLHDGQRYDVEIDTTSGQPEMLAAELIDRLELD